MYKNYCFVFLLLFTIILNSQVSKIELPTGEDDIKIKGFTSLPSIYVDRNNEVYLEKEPIKLCDIAKELSYIRYKMPFEIQMKIKVFLYIDNNADYNIVDEIKTQLASAYFERLYYKTNSIEEKDVLKGVSWTNHQSFYHLNRPEKVLTKIEQEKNKRFNDSINREFRNIPPPPPPPTNWFFDSWHIIYSDSKEAIDDVLEGKIFTCVTLTNKGYKKGNEILKFDEKEKIENLFRSNDIVFVKFSEDLKYENYFKTIKEYKELDVKKRGFLFELSHEILEIYKKSNINFCN